jgi:hypothetical protein
LSCDLRQLLRAGWLLSAGEPKCCYRGGGLLVSCCLVAPHHPRLCASRHTRQTCRVPSVTACQQLLLCRTAAWDSPRAGHFPDLRVHNGRSQDLPGRQGAVPNHTGCVIIISCTATKVGPAQTQKQDRKHTCGSATITTGRCESCSSFSASSCRCITTQPPAQFTHVNCGQSPDVPSTKSLVVRESSCRHSCLGGPYDPGPLS